jgi:hypothetical protein
LQATQPLAPKPGQAITSTTVVLGTGLHTRQKKVVPYPLHLGEFDQDHLLQLKLRKPPPRGDRQPKDDKRVQALLTEFMTYAKMQMKHDVLHHARYQRAFWDFYKLAEDNLADVGVRTRFYLATTTDRRGRVKTMFAPVSYRPVDDGRVWVGLISQQIIDGTVLFQVSCQPIDMAATWGARGWTMFRNPRIVYDLTKEGCPDGRARLPLSDSKGTDQPQFDGYFDHVMSIIDGWSTVPDYRVGDLLPDNEHPETSLSYAPVFVRPGEIAHPDLRIATSRSMVLHYPRPSGVRLGWGNYDMFEMWMSCGRRVNPDMVPEVAEGEKDWTKDSFGSQEPRVFTSDQGQYFVPRNNTEDHPPLPMTKELEFIAENAAIPMPASGRNLAPAS